MKQTAALAFAQLFVGSFFVYGQSDPPMGAPAIMRLCTTECARLVWANDFYYGAKDGDGAPSTKYRLVSWREDSVIIEGVSMSPVTANGEYLTGLFTGKLAKRGSSVVGGQVKWQFGIQVGTMPFQLTWKATSARAGGDPSLSPVPSQNSTSAASGSSAVASDDANGMYAAALPKSFHVCCMVGDKTICADVIRTGQGWTVQNDAGPNSSVTFDEFKDGRVAFTSTTPGSSTVKFKGTMDKYGNGFGDATVVVNEREFKGAWQSNSLESLKSEGRLSTDAARPAEHNAPPGKADSSASRPNASPGYDETGTHGVAVPFGLPKSMEVCESGAHQRCATWVSNGNKFQGRDASGRLFEVTVQMFNAGLVQMMVPSEGNPASVMYAGTMVGAKISGSVIRAKAGAQETEEFTAMLPEDFAETTNTSGIGKYFPPPPRGHGKRLGWRGDSGQVQYIYEKGSRHPEIWIGNDAALLLGTDDTFVYVKVDDPAAYRNGTIYRISDNRPEEIAEAPRNLKGGLSSTEQPPVPPVTWTVESFLDNTDGNLNAEEGVNADTGLPPLRERPRIPYVKFRGCRSSIDGTDGRYLYVTSRKCYLIRDDGTPMNFGYGEEGTHVRVEWSGRYSIIKTVPPNLTGAVPVSEEELRNEALWQF